MDERVKDYNNYDKLVLYVRNKKSEEIISYYKELGYELIEDSENEKYLDTKDLTFVRPHIIKNKDSLQLLQIHLEVELNKVGKLEQHKHAISINFTLSLILIGLFILIFGGYKFLTSTTIISKVLFCGIGTLGVVCLFLVLLFTPKIINKENLKFNNKMKELKKNIKKVIENIKKERWK